MPKHSLAEQWLCVAQARHASLAEETVTVARMCDWLTNSAWILNEIWKADAALEAVTWIERVPSASNCADHPSRGKFEILEELEVETKRVPVPQHFEKSLVEQWRLRTGRVGPRPM